jgi:hypothetical protein
MGFIGFGVSLLAAVFLLIGLIPLLGWLNWFTTLPASVIGAIFSVVSIAQSGSMLAVVGLIISVAVFAMALVRLSIGKGIF